MSYWDLWDNFAKVKENWTETKDLIYYLIEFFNHKSELENEYAAGLARLSRAALFNRGKNTVEPSVRRLQMYCLQQKDSLQTLILQQMNDLVPALKELVQNQDLEIKSKLKIWNQFESDLTKHEYMIKKCKDKYFALCECSDIPSKKEEDQCKSYTQSIEEGNKFLSNYEETMKGAFSTYQSQDEAKYKLIQDSFRKFIIFQMSFLRTAQYEIESMSMAADSISPSTETKKFISDNLSSKHFKKFQIEVHPKRVNFENSFLPKHGTETLEKIIDKCWKGVLINDEDNKHFNDLVTTVDGRKVISNKLNERRVKEEFIIPSCTFGIVCGLFSGILDKVLEFQDVFCAKQIMQLSQCFYEETMHQRTYLRQIVLTHPVWEDYKIWSKLIITSVEVEMENDAKICAEEQDSLGQALKLRPVLTSKVTSFLQNMNNFMVDNSVVEKTMKVIQEYYSFTVDVSIKSFE